VLGRWERTLNSAPIVERITIANTDMTILVCLSAPHPLCCSFHVTHHDHAFMAETTGFTMVGGCSASGIARRRVYGGALSAKVRRASKEPWLVDREVRGAEEIARSWWLGRGMERLLRWLDAEAPRS
jgi:hypothetical protein